MEKQTYLKSLGPIERLSALRSNAYSTKTEVVTRYYSDDELIDMKSRLSEVSIAHHDLQEQKKAENEKINAQIKLAAGEIKTILTDLKKKQYENTEEVFEIEGNEDGVMEIYDRDANLLYTRKMRPDERQVKIKEFNSKVI
jgi:hypothetical protein